jgi:hypothetical protein
LGDSGTLTVSANGANPAFDNPIQLIADTANTLNVFANDSDSQEVVYTVNGATYTLPTNSVAYWVSGQLVTFGGVSNVSLDVAEAPLGGGTIGTTENNLGKFGFSGSSSAAGLDYIIDNFQTKALTGTPEALYSLVVNFGGSGGLYTSGQQVVIAAHTNALKNFVRWSGDTAALANSNSATTTVTMPAAAVTVTAVYDVNVLTVNNGDGSGTYLTGSNVTIVATNTAPANQVFVQWGGTGLPYIANPLVTNTTLTMPSFDITVFPVYAGLLNGFEGDTVGLAPSVGALDVSTVNTASNSVLVVGAAANKAGTGQAVEIIDNDTGAGAGVEYDVASGKPSLSAAKASFAFAWKNTFPGGTNSSEIAVAFGEYDSTTSRRLGSNGRRWGEARLVEDGTVDFASGGATTNSADDVSNNNNALVENMKNTMTIFANDYDSTAVDYTVNGSTYSLPANSVAYWLNGRSITFGTNAYAPLDLSDVPVLGGTIGTTEGNLGKFGFSSGTTATMLDYIIDDLAVSDDPWAALYALRVIGGDNGGLYTAGTVVTNTANPWPGRTFKSWSGDVLGAVADTNVSPAVVTMPASGTNGVTLTAIYDNVVLTLNGGTAVSGDLTNNIITNTVGAVIAITASDVRAGVTFKEWAGTATQYVDNVIAASTTVTLPPQDINLAARYYYYLTITNGFTSGNYTNNATVVITASNLVGKTFAAWTGDTQLVDNVTNSPAVVTMSTNPASLTATYVDIPYTLTVNLGTGDGTNYTYGQVVEIVANDPISGQIFLQWTGSGAAYVANVFATNTTVTMPAANITVTADYGIGAVTLTGTAGSGGTISPTSTNVAIGGSQTFVITANTDYRISTLKKNGTDVPGVTFSNLSTSYNFIWTNVQAAGTASVSFVAQTTTVSSTIPVAVPYSWLRMQGITNNQDATVALDQDGDGVKTWAEWIAGTVPTNSLSLLKATQTAARSNLNVITWNSVTGRLYQVYWSTNLVKGFALKQDNITYLTNNATASYTNATPDSRLNHYQVRVRFQ